MLTSTHIPKKVVCVDTGTILDASIASNLGSNKDIQLFHVNYF